MAENYKGEPNPRIKLPQTTELSIIGAVVDGNPYGGKFNDEMLKRIPMTVMESGSTHDIAARVGFLAGLKELRGRTLCNEATLRVVLNGKEFIARFNGKMWVGKWNSEKLTNEAISSASRRLGNNS